jgi:hypothetical protein
MSAHEPSVLKKYLWMRLQEKLSAGSISRASRKALGPMSQRETEIRIKGEEDLWRQHLMKQ